MPLRFTSQMKKRLTQRAHFMLRTALRYFPELQGKTIAVGYTRAHLGTALFPLDAEAQQELTIRLKVRRLTYNTIGHELTHLVQGLSRFDQSLSELTIESKIPGGEKSCDIWTLARSELFCDEAPTYLHLPPAVRENWPQYANAVRAFCITAIQKRQNHRTYIRWLENQIRHLVDRRIEEHDGGGQLCLPFDKSR